MELYKKAVSEIHILLLKENHVNLVLLVKHELPLLLFD